MKLQNYQWYEPQWASMWWCTAVYCMVFGSFGNEPMQSCSVRRCRRRRRRLCTALPVTGLITEASYLTNICSYGPSICTWNIKSMWHIFLNGGHFSKFLYLALLSTWLNLEPSYLAQLCTCTGATHREEITHLSVIFLKLWIFLKIHILHFLTHWQTCQRY